ncbi:MBL fold metallo-hydrolase, partial [Acinetobacter baumannii]
MFFKQFFEQESSTYTYMLGCEETREAVLIDPVASDIEIYAKELEQHQFTLIYTLDTHVHADHITAANLLRERFHCKSVLHRNSEVSCGDILINDGCMLKVGNLSIEARYTPGHTNACTSYLVGNMIF